jgi:transposase InsO family protein
MDVRLVAAMTATTKINVSEVCREHGISRETFYLWRRRYQAAGLDGLQPRSSAPHRSPQRVSARVEELIVAQHHKLATQGLDAGAATVQWHLGRAREKPLPSVATVHRILRRHGVVTPSPQKRPKSSMCRFEAPAPNVLWQADATKWVIAMGQVEVLVFLDDHSRLVTSCRAVMTATCENTWEAFCLGVERWGLPSGHLSDNGLNFSGRLRGHEVSFEINLRAAGVRPITSRGYHPQTCGKVERFHQTLKKWLSAQPLARDLAELQDQLDPFIDYYNQQRPHRGIGRVTPLERWSATPKATNLGIALPAPQRTAAVAVDNQGLVRVSPWVIHVGKTRAGQQTRVMFDDTHAAVFVDGLLVRHLELDPSRPYQPSGTPRGRRRVA